MDNQIFFFLLVAVLITAWAVNKKKKREKKINDLKKAIGSFNSVNHTRISLFTSESEYLSLLHKTEDEVINILAERITLQHLKVLLIKKQQLTHIDDYGLEVRDEWDKELKYFTSKVLLPSLSNEYYNLPVSSTLYIDPKDRHLVSDWSHFVDNLLSEKEEDESYKGIISPYEPNMDGFEYEHYVAEIMRNNGWMAQVTQASGDHGADVIASKNDIKAAIQCKFYSGSVGNQSVQEAYSAKGFYDCDLAIVVSNSTFTPAARQAANKLDVRLMHHDELKNL